MAAERRQFLAEATLDLERRSYLAMSEMCESAAVLCERRHEELFGTGTRPRGFAGGPARRNAMALALTSDNMRKLTFVHDRWEETFAAYPNSLDEGRLAALFEHLSAYAEDLEAFTRGVEALKGVMTRKASAPEEPIRPAPKLPAAPAPPTVPPPTAPAPAPPAAQPVRAEASRPTPPQPAAPAAAPAQPPVLYYAGTTYDGRPVYYAVR